MYRILYIPRAEYVRTQTIETLAMGSFGPAVPINNEYIVINEFIEPPAIGPFRLDRVEYPAEIVTFKFKWLAKNFIRKLVKKRFVDNHGNHHWLNDYDFEIEKF